MSNSRSKQENKSYNPLHNSFILHRSSNTASSKEDINPLKLSHFYTKATSEFDYTEGQEQKYIVDTYESRIRNLESGY